MRIIRFWLWSFLGILTVSTLAMAGNWTANQFLYKPALGARGTAEKNTYDSGMDRVDARLGKEIWVGDPLYGSTLQAAITAIGSNPAILRVPPGNYAVTDNLTVPANIALQVERGATLSIADTKTLTINGPFDQGAYQVFSFTGTGKVVFGKGAVQEALPEWFGFTVSGTGSNNKATLQKLVDALTPTDKTYGGIIRFGPGTYTVTGPIAVNCGLRFTGSNSNTSIIYNDATNGSNLFTLQNTRDTTDPAVYFTGFENLQLLGNVSSGDGIYVVAPYFFWVKDCHIVSHGGRGIHTILGSSPYAWGQNVDIERSRIQLNQSGGVKLEAVGGGGDYYHIKDCSIDTNGYYGVYAESVVCLTIERTEFAGYNYGRAGIPAGVQHYPIVLNGGNNIIISHCGFENNSGEVSGTHIGRNIRTGFNGDTQQDATNNTQVLRIENNNFKAVGGNSGDLNHIRLNYVLSPTITNNFFEKASNYTGTVNAVELGNANADAKIVFLTNQWSASLNNRITGTTNSHSILWIDECDSTISTKHNIVGVVGDDDENIAFYARRFDRSYNTWQCTNYGKQSWGNGSSAPVKSVYWDFNNNSLRCNNRIHADSGFSTSAHSSGDVTGTAKVGYMPIYDENGNRLGYIQYYQGP
jgi:hypothetical protein